MRVILDEASKPGAALSPDGVIAALTSVSDPLVVISAPNEAVSLQAACHVDFGFLSLLRNSTQIDATSVAKAAALIRWVTTESQVWTDKSDPERRRLAVLLLTSACCDFDGSFWANLPGGASPSQEFLAVLTKVISGVQMSFGVHGDYDSAPIWEREAVERIKQADSTKDWEVLDRLWLSFRSAVRHNLVLTQTMRCLASFNLAGLTGALSSISQTPLAMQLTVVLSQTASLQLGVASDNLHIQFAALSHLAPRGGAAQVSGDDQKLLISLLLKVTSDTERWRTWVTIFGTRHALQEALGHVLAEASSEAVEFYVKALPLSTITSNGRSEVSVCLRSFRAAASDNRSKLLWKLAFERWKAWDFRSDLKDLSLTRVTESILDYAVVGYLTECITQNERDAVRGVLMAELGQIHRPWYADMTQYLDVVHRVMSRLQPYLQAEQVSKMGADWLQAQMQWPFDISQERYRAMTLSANLIE